MLVILRKHRPDEANAYLSEAQGKNVTIACLMPPEVGRVFTEERVRFCLHPRIPIIVEKRFVCREAILEHVCYALAIVVARKPIETESSFIHNPRMHLPEQLPPALVQVAQLTI